MSIELMNANLAIDEKGIAPKSLQSTKSFLAVSKYSAYVFFDLCN